MFLLLPFGGCLLTVDGFGTCKLATGVSVGDIPSVFDVNAPVVYRYGVGTIHQLLYHDPCCLTRYSLAGQCVELNLARSCCGCRSLVWAERHIPYEGLTLAMGKQAGDYRRVGAECWDQLMRLYGGGPAIYVDGPPVEDLSRFVCDVYPRSPVCFVPQEVLVVRLHSLAALFMLRGLRR